MNFDELQSAWNSDEGKDIVIPQSVEKLKAAKGPVERIRKTMRCELYVVAFMFPFLGAVPLLLKANATTVPYYVMYAALMIIVIFSYIKFYLFLKRLNANTLSSKDNLYEVYYDIKLHLEIYKIFTYSTIPLMLFYFAIQIMSIKNTYADKLTPHKTTIVFIILAATFVVGSTLLIIITEWWVKHAYGKYLKQVGAVLKELKEE